MDPVGYDADTQVYTYFDESTGKYYDTDHGRYGNLRHTYTASTAPQSGFNGEGIPAEAVDHDWKMMKPFFLLVSVALLTLLWYVNSAGKPSPPVVQCGAGFEKYGIVRGDTCWDIAEARKTSVEKLTEVNEGLLCDKLVPGHAICVPVME